jgi:hypothetical protein
MLVITVFPVSNETYSPVAEFSVWITVSELCAALVEHHRDPVILPTLVTDCSLAPRRNPIIL